MILLIDNYDSFSYNLYQLVGELEPDIRVIRNDELSVDEVLKLKPDGIIISPGPGRPEDAGIIIELIKCLGAVDELSKVNASAFDDDLEAEDEKAEEVRRRIKEECIPTLGVCLGHQAICVAFGGTITYASELMHGKQSETIFDTESKLFKNLPKQAPVARYHSLALDEGTLPYELKITAKTVDGDVMAVEHRRLPIYGMQFHPESIMTSDGKKMLENFIEITKAVKVRARQNV